MQTPEVLFNFYGLLNVMCLFSVPLSSNLFIYLFIIIIIIIILFYFILFYLSTAQGKNEGSV